MHSKWRVDVMEQSVLLLLYLFTCPLECSCIHTHNRNGLLLLNFLSSCPVGSTALPSVIIIVDVCFMDGKISEPLWWMVRGQVATGWDYMWKFRKINPTPEDGEKNLLADVGGCGCALCTCRVTQMGRPLHSSHNVGRSVGRRGQWIVS